MTKEEIDQRVAGLNLEFGAIQRLVLKNLKSCPNDPVKILFLWQRFKELEIIGSTDTLEKLTIEGWLAEEKNIGELIAWYARTPVNRLRQLIGQRICELLPLPINQVIALLQDVEQKNKP